MESLETVCPSLTCCVGIVSLNDGAAGWSLSLQQWLRVRPEQEQQLLGKLMDEHVDAAMEYLSTLTGSVLPFNAHNAALTLCSLLEVSSK